MNPPWVYTCSQSWTPLPPLSPYHPSGSSQCTSPKLPVSCIEPGLAIHFIYDIIHVSMPFSLHRVGHDWSDLAAAAAARVSAKTESSSTNTSHSQHGGGHSWRSAALVRPTALWHCHLFPRLFPQTGSPQREPFLYQLSLPLSSPQNPAVKSSCSISERTHSLE